MQVTFLTDEDKEELLISSAERHAKYFTITEDGVISLKPEYRGACPAPIPDDVREAFIKTYEAYIKSDNGYGVDGSKNADLPKCLVIPEVVDTTAVVSLAPGMFFFNYAVETIVLPSTITEISERFCDTAVAVRNVYNTERITSIGSTAFQCCGIEKAKFPNLTSFKERAFSNAGFLQYADIGNVTSIPNSAFHACNNLSRVKGGANVTSVGAFAFTMTYRLNSVEFLPKLKSIGFCAFIRSRLIYDWNSLSEQQCKFAYHKDYPYATALQLNPTNIWKDCAVKPAENPLPTLLSQLDERWWKKEIGKSQEPDATDDTVKTYSGGCVLFSVIHAYCALHNKTITHISEFEDIVKDITTDDGTPILEAFKSNLEYAEILCKKLGLTVYRNKEGYTQEELQKVYTAIAKGGYALLPMIKTSGAEGHCALAYGVKVYKKDGEDHYEFLIADSAFTPGEIIGGTDKGIKYSMVYQNMIHPGSDVFIVSLDNTK